VSGQYATTRSGVFQNNVLTAVVVATSRGYGLRLARSLLILESLL